MQRRMRHRRKTTSTAASGSKVRSRTQRCQKLSLTTSSRIVLLRPLTSAAELPAHPSLSAPYYSKALTEMVRSAQESLHREKATLWRMKRLLTQLRGDDTWVPCGAMHTTYDDWLLRGQRTLDPPLLSASSAVDHFQQPVFDLAAASELAKPVEQEVPKALPSAPSSGQPASPLTQVASDIQMGEDTSVQDFMAEAARIASGGDVDGASQTHPADGDGAVPGLAAAPTVDAGVATTTVNGDTAEPEQAPAPGLTNGAQPEERRQAEPSNTEAAEATEPTTTAANPAEALPSPPSEDQDPARLMPHRMTTRARAQQPSRTPSTPAGSGSPGSLASRSDASPPIHPLFAFPTPSTAPSAAGGAPSTLGLPRREAEDTRAFLAAYVSRQEEVVRGAEELHAGLLRAEQMRAKVLEWCKADGHVGEMSDGEDWYDAERWGLDAPLVKGRWEEDEEAGGVGKKTRGRREGR